jgi:hypothetical protein
MTTPVTPSEPEPSMQVADLIWGHPDAPPPTIFTSGPGPDAAPEPEPEPEPELEAEP